MFKRFGVCFYIKNGFHVPFVLGSIIRVPLRPQEGRFMNILLGLHHSRIDFLVKQVTRRNHRYQSDEIQASAGL